MEVANQQAEMPAADVAAMFIALAQFTGTVYPDRLDYVDYVLTSCYQASPPAIRLESRHPHEPLTALSPRQQALDSVDRSLSGQVVMRRRIEPLRAAGAAIQEHGRRGL